jgi:hypothetical protein
MILDLYGLGEQNIIKNIEILELIRGNPFTVVHKLKQLITKFIID